MIDPKFLYEGFLRTASPAEITHALLTDLACDLPPRAVERREL